MSPSARAAVLRSLPRHGFAPPPDAAAVPADPHAAFAAQVEALAAEFWTLAPAARRERWEALADAPVGPAAARLADLEPGLGVAPVAQTEPKAAELARLTCELFVLLPAARAARRLAWLTAADRTGSQWSAAARIVLRTDLPLARLDERLFDWVSRGARPMAVAAVEESAARVRRRPVADPLPAAPAAAAGGFGCLSGPGAILFAVIVVVRIIFAASGPSRSNAPPYTPPPYQPPPTFTTPTFPPPPVMPPADFGPAFPDAGPPPGFGPPGQKGGQPGARFTPQEVMDCIIYDITMRSNQVRPGQTAPRRYQEWVDRGKPNAGLAP